MAGPGAHPAGHRRPGGGGVPGRAAGALSPAWSAGLFGLWHVVPAARTLETNGVRRYRATWVAIAVVLSAGAGAVLWELREATGGLAAPALVHVAVNSGATVAAYVVLRRS